MLSGRSAKALLSIGLAMCVLVPAAGVCGQSVSSDEGKDWTILIFWDGDNNLEPCTEFCMGIWQSAMTSDEHINIVALVDLLSVEGTWMYEFHPGGYETVASLGERDMSDPAVLEEFLTSGLANYPAEKTMLVMQDHGFSWRGLCRDDTSGETIMTLHPIAQVLKDVRAANGGVGVDLLSMDACSMATIEVLYELRDAVPYFAASQYVVPLDGLAYYALIDTLMDEPTISAERLSCLMVDQYMEYYSSKTEYLHMNPYDQDFVGFSAYDMSKVQALGDSFIALTSVLEPLVADHAIEIKLARESALISMWANIGGIEYLPDVWTMLDGMKGIDAQLDLAIEDFEEAYAAALLNEGSSSRFKDIPQGTCIHFPPNYSIYECQAWEWARSYPYTGIGLDLIAESSWNQCLLEYYGWPPGTQSGMVISA